MEAGRHSIRWDGSDDFGSELARGIYLFQLHLDNSMQTEKFVLVR